MLDESSNRCVLFEGHVKSLKNSYGDLLLHLETAMAQVNKGRTMYVEVHRMLTMKIGYSRNA